MNMTTPEIRIGSSGIRTDVRKMSRRQLELVVAGVLALQCYRITDLLGNDLGILTSSASAKLIDALLRNLKEVRGQSITIEDVVVELEQRGFYAQLYPTQTIQIFQV